ncbi:MAG: fumarylacetoacetate hydrolase family protein [Pseudomonadota bacterium]
MAVQVVRYQTDTSFGWGVHADGMVCPLNEDWPTTGAFLTDGGVEAANAARDFTIPLTNLNLLSPVTEDAEYICQGLNYASHLREIGRDPRDAVHNIFFHKAASCICGPGDEIVRPAHVKALDYEIELGLIVSRKITGPVSVTDENLDQFLGGVVITNDISARDVQVSHEQFNKAKSYRTFGPTGPFLVLLSSDEWRRYGELELVLTVDGEERQRCEASDMIHKPGATLTELSEIRDLKPGDMIATGTPGGVALKVPGKLAMLIGALMSPAKRSEIIARRAQSDPDYLRPGNTVTCSISTPDRMIDLGQLENTVVGPEPRAV